VRPPQALNKVRQQRAAVRLDDLTPVMQTKTLPAPWCSAICKGRHATREGHQWARRRASSGAPPDGSLSRPSGGFAGVRDRR
jgi:hypothetical protein